MTTRPRSWELWAHRRPSGRLWHVMTRESAELHPLPHPLVPVLVEEILGDPLAPEVTHYGWQYAEGSRHQRGDVPQLIMVRRAGDAPGLRHAQMFLDMCFPRGLSAALEERQGAVIPLRVAERRAPQ